MTTLEKDRVLSNFTPNWDKKSPDHVIEGIACCGAESFGLHTMYYLRDTDGHWVDPTSGVKVVDEAKKVLGRYKYSFQELEAVEKAERLGPIVAWLSPLDDEIYKTSKAMFFEDQVWNSIPVTVVRSVVISSEEMNRGALLEAAQEMIVYSKEPPSLVSVEDLRSKPFDINSPISWISIAEQFIKRPEVWSAIRNGGDFKMTEEMERKAKEVFQESQKGGRLDPRALRENMEARRMFGSYDLSCPITIVEMISRGLMECSEIKCRNCGWKPKSEELKKVQEGKIKRCPDCGRKP